MKRLNGLSITLHTAGSKCSKRIYLGGREGGGGGGGGGGVGPQNLFLETGYRLREIYWFGIDANTHAEMYS